jgi:membrane protease YdiL (CAAX protease family)
VLSVLVIGPSEELLFRGVVQRYLSGVFSRAGAIGVTSVLFAVIHAPTFALAASGLNSAVVAGTIFAISMTLGYAYALTDNLVVPTVVHGVYDATLFGVAYVALQLGLF